MAKPAIIDDESIESELSLFEPEPDDLPDDPDELIAWADVPRPALGHTTKQDR